MRSYPLEFRLRVLAACDDGASTQEVAEQFGVSKAWVRRLKQCRREHGTVEARPRGGDFRSKLTGTNLERVRQMVEKQPDLTLEQLREQIQRQLKIKLSVMSVCRALQKLGLSFKKVSPCQ